DDVLRTMIGSQILEKNQMAGSHRIEESSIRKGQSSSDKARPQPLDFAVKHRCGLGRVTADRRKRLQRQDPDVTPGVAATPQHPGLAIAEQRHDTTLSLPL